MFGSPIAKLGIVGLALVLAALPVGGALGGGAPAAEARTLTVSAPASGLEWNPKGPLARHVEEAEDRGVGKPDQTRPEQDDAAHAAARIEAIAKAFGVPKATVENLRTTEQLGFGEIVRLLSLSKVSGKSVADLLAAHKQGKGWGELAREHNVHPGSLAHPGTVFNGQAGETRAKGPGAQGRGSEGKGKTHAPGQQQGPR